MRSNNVVVFWVLATVLVLVVIGCERDDSTVSPASFPSQSDVFLDGFTAGLDYQAFGGSKLDALEIDGIDTYAGTASMRFTVPDGSDPSANFAGGAFVVQVGRDLSSYDALTFYAKASVPASIGVAGFGNDNTGLSLYTVERLNFDVTTSWAKYSVPIPDAEVLGSERGLFHIAAGAVNNQAYALWIDEVQFESLGTIIDPEPVLASQTFNVSVGDVFSTGNLSVTFDDLGSPLTVSAMPSYFDFNSSDEAVATVAADGSITAVGLGSASITAELNGVTAEGSISVVVGEAPDGPSNPATVPGFDPGEVVSLYSDEYTNNSTIDTWSADWDMADVEDVLIAGDNVKYYSNLVFAGIEFSSSPVDASSMTNFYFNMWTPATVDGSTEFKVKLVDFGADGIYNESGGDDSESELTFTANTNPAIGGGTWLTLDLPLTDFAGLTGTSAVAQLIFSGTLSDIYVDNILFHSAGGGGGTDEPVTPAPTPSHDAADVTSLFSNAYSNNPVDTWSAVWDEADVEDVQIVGDDVKKYTNIVFAGIEFTSQTVNATEHTHLHFDFWTPDPTNGGQSFLFKLVDFGPDNAFDGGDDSEATVTLDASSTPPLATGQWVSFDILLDDFAALAGRANLAQIVFEGDPTTVYLDNLYFYTDEGGGGGDSPSSPAPTPAYGAGNVISLFCDEYDDVPVDTWSADWPDDADVEDSDIDGNAVKLYTNMIFAGIEFTSSTVNASSMTHFRIDYWTSESTNSPAVFKIKLVDFGANGVWDGGGDDTEHELTFDASSTPALQSGQWVTFDIPLSDFVNMTGRTSIAQLIFVSDPGPNTIYIDNVLFHN